MDMQKQFLENLEAIHTYTQAHKDVVSKDLQRLLGDLQWHRWQICLESLAAASASNFAASDREVNRVAFSIHGGQSNTKFTAEDVFSHLHHLVSRSQKGCCVMNKSPGFA